MDYFVSRMGDYMTDTQKIRLPTGITVKEIYDDYLRVYHNGEAIGKSSFILFGKKCRIYLKQR